MNSHDSDSESFIRYRPPLAVADEDLDASTSAIPSTSSKPDIPRTLARHEPPPDFLLHPPQWDVADASSSAQWPPSSASTPIPSRSGSPLPQFYSSVPSSTYVSDSESEPSSALLLRNRRNSWWSDDTDQWIGVRNLKRRRRRKPALPGVRKAKRLRAAIIPFIVKHHIWIFIALLILAVFAISLTLLLKHILNPDKEPLPWRIYCSIPSTATTPPSRNASAAFSPTYPFNALTAADVSAISSLIPPPFPPPNLEDYPPAGVFLGVFSTESAEQRRMLIRTTWAAHERSRNGAGVGDGGRGTSRLVLRFILGKPRSSWAKRIELEAQTYNDMIILPVSENMNYGKSHAYFSWASLEAWVPPLSENDRVGPYAPKLSYSNITAGRPIPLAKHDPLYSREEWQQSGKQSPWVRPDFVVKVDDDSFVMLAELEARLRVELHTKTRRYLSEDVLHGTGEPTNVVRDVVEEDAEADDIEKRAMGKPPSTTNDALFEQRKLAAHPKLKHTLTSLLSPSPINDPLIYWGYLVKNRFMAGELYALSWSIVEWVARDQQVKGMTKGKEDKQVAKWMRAHPRAEEVRWKSERCWIYDHPRAGTVYSHGFLFPSEATRVRKSFLSHFSSSPTLLDGDPLIDAPPAIIPHSIPGTDADLSTPASWAHSSVSTFGVPYNPPISDLTALQSVEALVEGSELSRIKSDGKGEPTTIAVGEAWARREGRKKQYEDKRVGGTVVVHFIKKNWWYLETALALLDGDETTERESIHFGQTMKMVYDAAMRKFSSAHELQ